ncbi:MAG: hypothetical protein IK127_03435 [Clostridia bacterium]|nr:hypothetical protein [Clostridia bacterium]
MRKRCLVLLSAILFLFPNLASAEESPRFPGPIIISVDERVHILENGDIEQTAWLDKGFSLLEEGNPFVTRYNIITGAKVTAVLPLGVPYLYGGQAASHVFAKAPDYVVQAAWIDSPAYYVQGLNYIYGFDCVGFVKWLWSEVTQTDWPTSDGILEDNARHIYDLGNPMPDWETVAQTLHIGDILILRHPDNHVAVFIGTLRMYGYIAEDVPELAAYLDYPLVIHSCTNAAMTPRFTWLIENGLEKYRGSQTTDGGVCVTILGVPKDDIPCHVFAQNQDTWYFPLPDGTWLPVLLWEDVKDYCWWRGEL